MRDGSWRLQIELCWLRERKVSVAETTKKRWLPGSSVTSSLSSFCHVLNHLLQWLLVVNGEKSVCCSRIARWLRVGPQLAIVRPSAVKKKTVGKSEFGPHRKSRLSKGSLPYCRRCSCCNLRVTCSNCMERMKLRWTLSCCKLVLMASTS